jgi:hypothetical protein
MGAGAIGAMVTHPLHVIKIRVMANEHKVRDYGDLIYMCEYVITFTMLLWSYRHVPHSNDCLQLIPSFYDLL